VEDDENLKGALMTCVMSGHCCLVAPCVYGEAGGDGVCVYLAQPDSATGQRACKKYDEIVEAERKEKTPFPMMGSGCSSTLFNTLRDDVINRITKRGPNEPDE